MSASECVLREVSGVPGPGLPQLQDHLDAASVAWQKHVLRRSLREGGV